MTVRFGQSRMEIVTEVYYETPHPKTGKMRKQLTSYCQDVDALRRIVERKGGRILRVGEPRAVETTDVYI